MTLAQNYKFAKFGLETEICSNFYEMWLSEQIKHASYEYNTLPCLELVNIVSEWLYAQNDYRL